MGHWRQTGNESEMKHRKPTRRRRLILKDVVQHTQKQEKQRIKKRIWSKNGFQGRVCHELGKLIRTAMEKVIQGILKFQNTVRPSLFPTLRKLANKAEPQVLFVACMDSRIVPDTYTSASPGHMFVIRNAGNFVPHARLFGSLGHTYSEHAALELAVAKSDVKHVAVCGHSNCKAMEGLYKTCSDSTKQENDSALENWIKTHGQSSMTKLDQLIVQDGKPVHLVFGEESDPYKIEAVIDKDDKLNPVDKLSQINVLQQLHNIRSYSFVRERLKTKELQLHALWFDIGDGQMFLFSRQNKTFEPVNENTLKTHFK